MPKPRKESYEYRDEGCDVSPLCQLCPLDDCKYRDVKDHPSVKAQLRNPLIIESHNQGKTIPQLAQEFSLSKKTVHRIINKALKTAKTT